MDVACFTQGKIEDNPCPVVPTARPIEDLNSVHYPNGVAGPNTELNTYSQPGKFKYDREFLLQFKAVCTEKPEKMRTICIIATDPRTCSLHDMQAVCSVPKYQSKKKCTKTKHGREEGTAKSAPARDGSASVHSASGNPPPLVVLGPTHGEKDASRGLKIKARTKNKVKDKKKKTIKAFEVSVGNSDEGAGPSQEHKGWEIEKAGTLTMSEGDTLKKIDKDVKSFFSGRDLDEAEAYFSGLPHAYHQSLVDGLVSRAIETNEADAALVADFFARAASKNLCSPASFEKGFLFIAEFVDDIAINTPNAWDFMAIMAKGANFDVETQSRIASQTPEAEKLLALLS